jgi:hypothetical protein
MRDQRYFYERERVHHVADKLGSMVELNVGTPVSVRKILEPILFPGMKMSQISILSAMIFGSSQSNPQVKRYQIQHDLKMVYSMLSFD